MPSFFFKMLTWCTMDLRVMQFPSSVSIEYMGELTNEGTLNLDFEQTSAMIIVECVHIWYVSKYYSCSWEIKYRETKLESRNAVTLGVSWKDSNSYAPMKTELPHGRDILQFFILTPFCRLHPHYLLLVCASVIAWTPTHYPKILQMSKHKKDL